MSADRRLPRCTISGQNFAPDKGVLSRHDARIASARGLQSDAYWVQELPRLIEERATFAELIEAAKKANEQLIEATKYDSEEDEVGCRVCCNVVSYAPHEADCPAIRLRDALDKAQS